MYFNLFTLFQVFPSFVIYVIFYVVHFSFIYFYFIFLLHLFSFIFFQFISEYLPYFLIILLCLIWFRFFLHLFITFSRMHSSLKDLGSVPWVRCHLPWHLVAMFCDTIEVADSTIVDTLYENTQIPVCSCPISLSRNTGEFAFRGRWRQSPIDSLSFTGHGRCWLWIQ